MAIKISGTTVINDTRAVENVTTVTASGNVSANAYIGDGSLLTGIAAGGGGGNFNTSINAGAGYLANTSLSTGFTMPSTADTRYVIHSLQATNIGTVESTITGSFNGTNMTNISFGNDIPLPVESSVELLKKPKVLYPSATIEFLAGHEDTVHVTVAYEIVSGTDHFGAGLDVTAGDVYSDLFTATGNGVIESLLLSNDDGVTDSRAYAVWTDGSDNIQGYFAYAITIPAGATVELLDAPKYIPSGYKVRIKASVADRLEALIAGKYA